MDIQARVEARRAELAQSEKQAKEAANRVEQVRLEAERAQREEAIDSLAAELSSQRVAVRRVGEDLEIVHPISAPLNVEGLKHGRVDRLLKREARKMWSPAENWLVISLIVAGVFALFFLWWAGFLLMLIGFWRGNGLNSRYRVEVRERYPEIFAAFAPARDLSDTGGLEGEAAA